jgi:hypothetical protein
VDNRDIISALFYYSSDVYTAFEGDDDSELYNELLTPVSFEYRRQNMLLQADLKLKISNYVT